MLSWRRLLKRHININTFSGERPDGTFFRFRFRFLENGPGSSEPEVLQSGFGVNFLILAQQILGKLPAHFSANFDGDAFRELFGLVFSRVKF